MTADTRTGDATQRRCGLPAGERGPARTPYSAPDALGGKAAR